MVDAIYQWMIKQWKPRYDKVQKNSDWADIPYAAYCENNKYSKKYYAIALSRTTY